ncbi:hypothetical protein MMC26_003163 [Xylographa opegraphella]|nr:hypothetical protein [Xylographa opegraphella]
MPRVRQHRATSRAPSAARRILTNRDKPTYKVVLEEVTQKKKKLITVGSSKINPPGGYTFIPAGDPQITNRCKDIARKDGATVFAVSTTRHKHSDLSKEVHRIGYHFPSSTVDRACLSLGVSLSRDGRVLRHQHDWIEDAARSRDQNGTRLNLSAHNTSSTKLSQATIDTQAREAIRDLFPKIPDKDLRDIVTHAFELGKSRVGTAPELPLPRRVQLAVVAHIRHTYTDYDNLLKEVPWNAARAMIEQASLNKLAQWRGDDDDEPDAMEDILREIIVIPDDDEEDANEAGNRIAQGHYDNPHDNVEIITTRQIVNDKETQSIDYLHSPRMTHGAESPNTDDDQEVIFLGHGQYVIDRPDQARIKRNRDHRHRAWVEARDRFRYPAAQPQSSIIRPLTQAVSIASGLRERRGSNENTEKIPLQQHSANDQRILYEREAQPLRNLSFDHATHQSMVDHEQLEVVYPEQRGPNSYHEDENMNDEQQLSKRRRIHQGHYNLNDLNPLHNDLQRSLLVPVDHTHEYEFWDGKPNMIQRINCLESSVRNERPQDAREPYRISELEQRDVSAYQPIHPEHDYPSGTKVPHHGQILVTQKQPSSHISVRSPVKPVVQKAVPDFDELFPIQNVSYLPRSSHISLPRQDLRTSHAIAYELNDPTAHGSPQWDENLRVLRPVFDQTSKVNGCQPSHNAISQTKPRTSAEQSGIYLVRESPMQIPLRRSRKALPLERSFEHLRPIENRIPRGEMDRPEGSLQDNAFGQVVTMKCNRGSQVAWPEIQKQQDLALDNLRHGEKQQLFDKFVVQGDR